jgi:hypothetical protein
MKAKPEGAEQLPIIFTSRSCRRLVSPARHVQPQTHLDPEMTEQLTPLHAHQCILQCWQQLGMWADNPAAPVRTHGAAQAHAVHPPSDILMLGRLSLTHL